MQPLHDDNRKSSGTPSAIKSEFNSNKSNNQLTLPSISLPKGGGAIRGMGEKFGANPVTGTASVSVPIFTSPGRSGFGPALSISYDSGSGNGIFGFGWNLSLPSISRKTDKGLPRYEDADESDTFILSEAEDLVPFLNPDGTHYEDPDTAPDYVIYRYRPRIEGLFARIERWTRKSDGDIHWRSISRENITTLYGKSENSRIADPDYPLHIFSWLICESYDGKGNAIIYEYVKENSAQVDQSAVHEKNRSENSRSVNLYLKRIKYGNLQSRLVQPDLTQMNWMFEVVFDYGEHDQNKPTPNDSGEWLCRHDPFSTYRAGFEVRTYRLCQRVLMFHHFPEEEGVGNNCLIRSTDFVYRNIRNNADDLKKGHPIASFIASVTQSGYKRRLSDDDNDSDGGYLKRSLPSLEFEYSKATIDEEIREIDSESLQNLPYGIDGLHYQWVDLDGEGVSGVLTEQGDAWFYKPNLGGGRFGPIERVAFKPSIVGALNGAGHKLLDLAGDGQLDLVDLSGPTPGFYERNDDQNWEGFVPFESLPNVNWNDPNLRFVDLTGDGHADILVTKNEVLTWYPSLAERGFGSASSTTTTTSATSNLMQGSEYKEEHGPRLVFSDSTQSIYLADMSGDGLTDLVRIRNGDICYWPNLGYGRFGSKVTMDNSPWFDALDMFDQSRIRLADIDGSGVTDIIYMGHDGGVRLYFNESGNSWTESVLLNHFPHINNISSIMALDLLGNGTACLVWSSPLIGDARSSLRYIDLMGSEHKDHEEEEALMKNRRKQGKPHLLISIKNNMGAETHIEYESSTKFYLADKAAGKPWVTKLPFPAHVVERVMTYDYISRNFFVRHYTYHHGYFDGIEREFRGFGMVEQYDTEEFATLSSNNETFSPVGKSNIEASSHVPPVLTKTWYHTGIYLDRDHISNFFAGILLDADDPGEYYREPKLDDTQAKALLLADTELPPELSTPEEEREACRALKGLMLRQEVYALDDTPKSNQPYVVTEQNFAIQCLQPRHDNRHAVFFTHAREAINFHYERKLFPVLNGQIVDENIADTNPDVEWLPDPRVQHALTLEVDRFGNVLRSVAIGYGRRMDALDPALLQQDHEKQRLIHIICTKNTFTNPILDEADAYRTPMPAETCIYELRKPQQERSGNGLKITKLFQFDELLSYVDQAGDGNHDIDYEDFDFIKAKQAAMNPEEGEKYFRRPIEQVRILYRPDDLGAGGDDDPLMLLHLGMVEPLALPGECYKLAFTPGLLAQVFQRDGHPLMVTDPNDSNNVLGGDGADRGGYVPSQFLKAEGKFPNTDPDNHWWIPSGRVFFSPTTDDTAAQELAHAHSHYFLPNRYRDPFHTDSVSTESVVNFDSYDLLILESRDAVGNLISVGHRRSDGEIDLNKPRNDYRVLQPRLVTDPNRNRTEVLFDTLGMVTGTAVMGKEDESQGDTLNGFEPDVTQAQINGFYDASDPHLPAANFLKGATTRIIYDLHRFRLSQEAHSDDPAQWLPVYSASLARETHVSDPLLLEDLKIQISFSYSDGFGRAIQKKIQTEPDLGAQLVIPRWVGSGWTIFNNKGRPVRQYEPFFSQLPPETRHHFEFGMQVGVSPILFYDPVERVVAALHPNHTYEKVVFDPWEEMNYDVNDTVAPHGMQTADPRTDPDIHGYVAQYFATLNDPTLWKTWFNQRESGAMGAEEQIAAIKAAAHANTPSAVYLDTLGRPFLKLVHNRFQREEDGGATVIVDEKYATRIEVDIEGNERKVRDAVDQNGEAQGRIVMRYDYDMLGNRIHQLNMDAGARWMLNDVAAKPIRAWDCRDHAVRIEYDPLRRPLRCFVIGADPANPDIELLTERTVYGEQHPEDQACNLRGVVYLHLDQAGVVIFERYDFKGNPLLDSRHLAKRYNQATDWRSVDSNHSALPINAMTKLDTVALEAALTPLLEEDDDYLFTSSITFDALNRPIQVIFPHSKKIGTKLNVTQPIYNEANLLERIVVWLELDTEPTGHLDPTTATEEFIKDIDYNAKGQRELIKYGNGVTTSYEYDQSTFRLMHLQTLREEGSVQNLQDLSYVYDPIGNIVSAHDDSQQTIFFNGQVVKPGAKYMYDAIYRLIQTEGREHIGQPSQPHSTWDDKFRVNLAHPNDGEKMRNYLEVYSYDKVGNILNLNHRIAERNNGSNWIGNWIRTYDYLENSLIEPDKKSNRLSRTVAHPNSQQPLLEPYTYDTHGSMTSMPHLRDNPNLDEPNLHWDFKDQLNQVDLGGGGTVYYVYDATGHRVRKVHKHIGALVEERIYLGNFEVYRKHNGNGLKLERETLHIMADNQRVTLVETRTVDVVGDDQTPARTIRYQLSNKIGSTSLELNELAEIISYEEYSPYGSTTYLAVRKDIEVSRKRYRYRDKERDDETGFYNYGARLYAPWLGRWTSADPIGFAGGHNLYAFCIDNPIMNLDRTGTDPIPIGGTDEIPIGPLIPPDYSSGYGGLQDVEISNKMIEDNQDTGEYKSTEQGTGWKHVGEGVYQKYYFTKTTTRRPGQVPQTQVGTYPFTDPEVFKGNLLGLPVPDPQLGPEGTRSLPNLSNPRPKPKPQPSKKEGGGIFKSFLKGLVKGFVKGVIAGLIIGAMIASGFALVVAAGYILAAAGVAQLVHTVGQVIFDKNLTAEQKAEMLGEVVGGLGGGRIGVKYGGKIPGRLGRGGAPAGGGGGAPIPTRGLGGRILTAAEQGEFDAFGARAQALGLVENLGRTGSWGRMAMVRGRLRFQELARIDVAEAGRPGWEGRTHIHITGQEGHLDPTTRLPGE